MVITANYRRKRVKVEALVWDGANLLEAVRLMGRHIVGYDRASGTLSIKLGEEVLIARPEEWLILAEDEEPLPPSSASVFERLYEPVGTNGATPAP